MPASYVERILAVIGDPDVMARELEQLGHAPGRVRVVIDDEHPEVSGRRPDDREPDAQAPLRAVERAVAPGEEVEQLREQIRRVTEAVVTHAKDDLVPFDSDDEQVNPPDGVYLAAFVRRLTKICSSRVESASSFKSGDVNENSSSCFRSSYRPNGATAGWMTRAASMSFLWSERPPETSQEGTVGRFHDGLASSGGRLLSGGLSPRFPGG